MIIYMPTEFEGLTVYTAEEVAEALDVALNTVRGYLKEGKITGRKLGKKWFIPAESLREYFLSGDSSDEDESEEA
jgi:excisionase family DNA binding protein